MKSSTMYSILIFFTNNINRIFSYVKFSTVIIYNLPVEPHSKLYILFVIPCFFFIFNSFFLHHPVSSNPVEAHLETNLQSDQNSQKNFHRSSQLEI